MRNPPADLGVRREGSVPESVLRYLVETRHATLIRYGRSLYRVATFRIVVGCTKRTSVIPTGKKMSGCRITVISNMQRRRRLFSTVIKKLHRYLQDIVKQRASICQFVTLNKRDKFPP